MTKDDRHADGDTGRRPRLLFVDDSEDDVELMLRRLRRAGLDVEWARVADERGLREALADGRWDAAVVDYSLPGFSGLAAIDLIRRHDPDLPMVTVSGAIDEETAVATLTRGAVDYVLKENLVRLAPAVRRALEAAARREARREAERARVTQFILDHSPHPVVLLHEDGTVLYASPRLAALGSGDPERPVGRKVWELDPTVDEAVWRGVLAAIPGTGRLRRERTYVDARGEVHVFEVDLVRLTRDGQPVVAAYLHDVTSARAAEAALRESERRFAAFARHLPGYLVIYDQDLRYVYVNEHGIREDDLPAAEWLGRRPTELWPAPQAEAEEESARRALAGQVVDTVEEWEAPGGGRDHMHCLYFPIPQHDGSTLVGCIAVDVGEAVRAQRRLREALEGTVAAMSQVVETRDPYTAGHERRVAELAVAIGRELGLDEGRLEGLRIAATVHDIGKIAVPAEILTKPDRLSPAEFAVITPHPRTGHDILAGIDFGHPVAAIVLQHHERLDGSGYPQGLRGDEILPEARIIAVADVVEAMSSHRPYRPALGLEAALAEIEAGAGSRYDPDVAAACLRAVHERGFRFSG